MSSFYNLFGWTYLALVISQGLAEEVHISTSPGFDELVIESRDTFNLYEHDTDTVSSKSPFREDFPDSEQLAADSLHRRRRSIVIQGGAGGMSVQDFSASQTCAGITLSWKPPNLPFSPKYDYSNTEFKHYNVYRSRSFFSDVTHMKPYASGLQERTLREVQTKTWTDLYPTPMVDWFYAVTVVDGRGNEETRVTAQKVRFIGAIQKEGPPLPVMPALLKGRVKHHSVAYNPNRNEYFIAFDLDINGDGLPDHLYGLRLNQAGEIVGKTILNFTATVPGWAGGEQGWPAVAFNPRANEYLALFHFRSRRHFSGKFIILGQRVFDAKTERKAAPFVVFKANLDTKEPRIMYNPVTGGYVSSLILARPKKDVYALYLNNLGKGTRVAQVCSFVGHSYEHNIFLDSKRNEFFFTCLVEKKGARLTGVKILNNPYLVVLTKKNATGGHAANTPSHTEKNFVSFTTKRSANLEGYFNNKADRLFLFWEDIENGRHMIQKAAILLTKRQFYRENNVDRCPLKGEVKTPVPLALPLSGSHYLLWQERDTRSWSIGGRLMKGNFNLANREQKSPVVVYNMRADLGLVVWQEVVGNQVRLISRHFKYSVSHTCTPACTNGQRCAQQDTCAVSGPDFCSSTPCSHTCTNLPNQRYECSCPKGMQLRQDKKTCSSEIVPCHGMTPLKNPSTNRNYFCGRGPARVTCPSGSFCHVHPTDRFAVCCKDPVPSHTVMVTSLGNIWQATVNSGQRHTAIKRLPITQGLIIVAMAFDPVDKRLYWSDVAVQKISRAYLDGRGEETVINSNVLVTDGMCLDTVERKIYWTDIGLKRIQRADLDGSNREVLETLEVEKPRAIVLYRKRRQMYWTDWGATAKIERASMDGGQRKTIVAGGLVWPNGIVLDETASQLYWADAKLDKIETSDLEGRFRRVLVGGDIAKHPFSLAILNDRLFWSDWDIMGVQSVDKNTGKDNLVALQGLVQPKGLLIMPSKVQPAQTPCPDPGPPADGSRHPKPRPSGDYAVGTKVIFSCNPEYVQIGESSRVCTKSGKWSGKRTSCSVRPVFTSTPKNKSVSEGDSPLLKCAASVRGRPMVGPSRVKWFKDGIAMPTSSEGHYFTTYKGHLVFLVVHGSDTGLYTCKATTKAATIEASAFLKVRAVFRFPDCGNPRFQTRARIIGGRQAGRGAHPWQAMLWKNKKRMPRHFCGGSLITDRWVVTAAHCVSGPDTMMPSQFKIRLGKHVRSKKEPNEQVFDPEMIKIHPHYVPGSFDSDIALIRLKKKVTFTDYVKPICLPSESSDYRLLTPNTTGTISGWGKRKTWRGIAKRLHEATIPIVTQQACRKSHPTYIVTANMFCAGFNDSSKGDACQGDSGGPFAVDNPIPTTRSGEHRHVLLGIISWGDGCGKIGKYGVYTRIFNYIDWILNEITF